ncbi:MAG: GNAT family N-acetyltransferase [Patescibacteria group bacterium]
MEIEGEKIIIRQNNLSEFNYNFILRWLTDPEVMKYVGYFRRTFFFKSKEQAREFFEALEDGVFFGIYLKNSDELIGYATLSNFNPEKKECKFGIVIGEKRYWGQGAGSEVALLVAGYAFIKLKQDKVTLTCAEANRAAIKAYENAGFEVVQRIPKERTIFLNGRWQLHGTIKMSKDKK